MGPYSEVFFYLGTYGGSYTTPIKPVYGPSNGSKGSLQSELLKGNSTLATGSFLEVHENSTMQTLNRV